MTDMDERILDMIGNIIMTVGGLMFAIFYKYLARESAAVHYRQPKTYHIKLFEFGFLFGGILFVILGILNIFGII
jgi:hypothetical protein